MSNELIEQLLENEPTVLDKQRIEHYIKYLLNISTDSHDHDREKQILEALKELVWKYSDTFTYANKNTAENLLKWVKEHWIDEYQYIDSALSILSNMSDCNEINRQIIVFLNEKRKSLSEDNVKYLIDEMIKEFEG